MNYTDKGGPAQTKTFNLRLRNVVYRDISSIADIVDRLAVEVLKRTGLERLIDQMVGAEFGKYADQAKGFLNKFLDE